MQNLEQQEVKEKMGKEDKDIEYGSSVFGTGRVVYRHIDDETRKRGKGGVTFDGNKLTPTVARLPIKGVNPEDLIDTISPE
jgi:hypothetical protein